MKSNTVSSGQSGLASQYNNLRADAYGGSELLTHEQGTPNMTLYVEPGAFYINGTRVIFGGGNSPTITAPTSHPRIDILTIDSSGTLAITQGTEASSPVVPSYPSNKVVLCEIYNRVGETSVKDADDSTNGYIYNDVRPILEYPINPAAIASDMIPDVADTRDLGSSGTEWNNVYAKTIYQSGKQAAFAQFGGTGADGALTISSGVTTINLGGANYYELNYTSVSINAVGGGLTFSNPSVNGCVVVIKCQGNFTLTAGEISGDGLGASASNDGFGLARGTKTAHNISIGVFPSGGGSPTSEPYRIGAQGANVISGPFSRLAVFSGSGGQPPVGGSNHGPGGAGGIGISIECAGALDFTATITSNGLTGANGSGSTSWDGWYTPGAGGAGESDNSDSGYTNVSSLVSYTMGGGGGGGGSVVILYNFLTANTGTITVNGGVAGTGTIAGQSGTAGFSYVGQNTVFT